MTKKLYRRADGAAESSDGLIAIIPTKGRKIDAENSIFSFKGDPYAPATRVQWKTDSGVALLPFDIARTMVKFNYAIGLTQEQVDQWNALVDDEEPALTDAAQKKVDAAISKAAAEAVATNIFESGASGAGEGKGGDSAPVADTSASALDAAAKGGDNGQAKDSTVKVEPPKKAAPPLRT